MLQDSYDWSHVDNFVSQMIGYREVIQCPTCHNWEISYTVVDEKQPDCEGCYRRKHSEETGELLDF